MEPLAYSLKVESSFDVSLIPYKVPASGASTHFQKHIALYSALSLN